MGAGKLLKRLFVLLQKKNKNKNSGLAITVKMVRHGKILNIF